MWGEGRKVAPNHPNCWPISATADSVPLTVTRIAESCTIMASWVLSTIEPVFLLALPLILRVPWSKAIPSYGGKNISHLWSMAGPFSSACCKASKVYWPVVDHTWRIYSAHVNTCASLLDPVIVIIEPSFRFSSSRYYSLIKADRRHEISNEAVCTSWIKLTCRVLVRRALRMSSRILSIRVPFASARRHSDFTFPSSHL